MVIIIVAVAADDIIVAVAAVGWGRRWDIVITPGGKSGAVSEWWGVGDVEVKGHDVSDGGHSE